MIKILIIDDSPTETALLKHILESENDFQVIGCAKDGKEGIQLAKKLKPDIVTMDLFMPELDGFEATKAIMSNSPIPIIVISTKATPENSKLIFQALDAGAVSVLEKPVNIASSTFKELHKHIVDTIRNMAGILVIKKRFGSAIKKSQVIKNISTQQHFEIVAIGASIGGPAALKEILSQIPGNFPVPIVIVQHMTKGFITGFANWISHYTELTVKEAKNMEILNKGTVYFAPDDYHLEIIRSKDNVLMSKLLKKPPVSGFCPSANILFKSIAKTCGKNAIGVILTGMGSDGAEGLLQLKQAHAHTLTQDKKSAVVFGMASVAQSLGAVDREVDLHQIADYLTQIFKH